MKKFLVSFLFSGLIFLAVFGAIFLEKQLINFGYGVRIFSPVERILLDLRFFFREANFENRSQIQEYLENNRFVSHETLVVGIDQESLLEIGEWPWYRNIYKDFLKKIQYFSPIALHLDIIFNLREKVPVYMEDKLKQSNPKILGIVEKRYREMDDVFVEELKNYDNVFVDQLLLKNKFLRFESDFVKKLALNEQILEKNSIFYTFPEKYNPPYLFTEPLIQEVMQNTIPSIVNAEPDSDKILRKSILLYPYQNQKDEKVLLSSVYLLLLLNYYNIAKNNVEILPDRVVLKDAMVPKLEQINKNPVVEEWEFSKLSSVLTQKHFQGDKYNQNLYRYIINIYRVQFQNDEVRVPEYPIHILDNENNTYSIIRGREIYDAASELQSKFVKVIVKKRKNIEIPIFHNEDNNPFSFFINFGSKQVIQGYDKNGANFSEFTLPKRSFKDIYNTPYLPKIPSFDSSTSQKTIINNFVSQPKVKKWFETFLSLKIKSIQKAVFNLYNDIKPTSMLKYAVEDNHYEGFLYLIYLYIQQKEWQPNPKNYSKFVVKLFNKNNITLDHPLIKDFLFDEKVIYNFLIDVYGQGYQDFYGKSIFVGALTTGMALDVHKTTYGDMFGITTIVNSFNTVIKDNLLKKFDSYKESIALLLFCLIIGLIYTYVPLLLKYIFIFLFTIIIFVVSVVLFNQGYILNTFPFIVSNIFIFGIVILYTIFVEQRDKKFLQLSFSDYLAPELIEKMYQKKERPQLGGEEKKITAYFTDIQSFSSFSELLTPSQLVDLLNEYLGKMTDILMAERGTLDKYEGDAIIAFFGAPSYLGDESFRACKTAILMQKALMQLREKWKQEKTSVNLNKKNASIEKWDSQFKWPFMVHDMKMRIGINSGDVVVGNMGSEKRKNYTMMGDAVNLAARLESLAKQYGIYTIISEYVMEAINRVDSEQRATKEFIFARFLDRVNVVGKDEPINIYELFCLSGEESPELMALKEAYENGMDWYLKCEWTKAEEFFKKSLLLEANQKINPSKVMSERCTLYYKNPPVPEGEVWDGVFKQIQK